MKCRTNHFLSAPTKSPKSRIILYFTFYPTHHFHFYLIFWYAIDVRISTVHMDVFFFYFFFENYAQSESFGVSLQWESVAKIFSETQPINPREPEVFKYPNPVVTVPLPHWSLATNQCWKGSVMSGAGHPLKWLLTSDLTVPDHPFLYETQT